MGSVVVRARLWARSCTCVAALLAGGGLAQAQSAPDSPGAKLPPVVVDAPRPRAARPPVRSTAPTQAARAPQRRSREARRAPVVAARRIVAPAPGAAPPVPASSPSAAAPSFPGGQVAREARVGLLGAKSYLTTPFSITSFTEKTVRDQHATSVAEVLTNSDPAVRAAIGSNNRYDAITIRGFRVESAEFALNGLYGLVPNYRINPVPIERIELLKGPGAFLYGMAPQGSIGGTVNVETKRAGDQPLTRLSTGIMSNGRYDTQIDVARRFGDNNEWGVRAGGSLEQGDTVIDRQSVRNRPAFLALDYKGDRLRVSADLIYQKDFMREGQRGYGIVPGIAVPRAPDMRTNLAQRFDYSHAESLTAMGRAEYDLTSNVTLFGAIGVNRFAYDKREAPSATILSSTGAASSVSTAQNGRTEGISGEAGIRSHFETGPVRHDVVVSASALQTTEWFGQTTYPRFPTNIYVPSFIATPGLPTSFLPVDKASRIELRSVGVADTMSVLDGALQLIVGVRQQQVLSDSYAPLTGFSSGYDRSATTPSVAVVVKPTQQWSLYASYIEGLTPGPRPPNSASNPTAIFAPFKTQQYEVGTKLDFGTFGATLAAYQIAMPSGLVDPFTNVFSLSGEQRNRGIELNAFGEIAPGLRILGGVTYLDAKLTKTAGRLYDGNRALGSPEWQSNVGVEWDIPYVPGLTATARAVYTGSAYVSQDNSQKVPEWTTFDLGARYATVIAGQRTTFRAGVTNVTDKHYWIANPSGFLINGVPRTVWASMQVDF